MPGRMDFEFRFNRPARAAGRSDSAPFRLLFLADLSGREARGALETGDALAARRAVKVDVDTFDGLFAKLAPRARLVLGSGDDETAVEFAAKNFDDFSADHLYRTVPLFAAMRETRARLENPATFAEEVALLGGTSAEPESPAGTPPDDFERLLGRPAVERPAQAAARRGLDRLLRDAVRDHLVPSPDPRQEEFVSAVDAAAAAILRSILRHPVYRGLETSWLALKRLVSSLETGEELTIHVLDVSRRELFEDLRAAGAEPERSGLYRTLVEQGSSLPGGHPWSLAVAGFDFRPVPEDAGFAAALAAVLSTGGAPLIAAAHVSFLGVESVAVTPMPERWPGPSGPGADAWNELRRSPWARWIGLTFPRILSRLPYGTRGERTEALRFEEVPSGGDAEAFPWGSAAAYAAELVARAFLENGWEMEPGDLLDVEDLPTFIVEEDGEQRLAPIAEAHLGERGGEALLARGFMPVLGYRDRGAARILRFQSIAEPPAPLAGPWSEGR